MYISHLALKSKCFPVTVTTSVNTEHAAAAACDVSAVACKVSSAFNKVHPIITEFCSEVSKMPRSSVKSFSLWAH